MNEYLNVLDFGAKGDGAADDTIAIQKAIDRAAENKNTVYFPAGTYMCSGLILHAFVGLQGVCNWGYSDIGGSELKLNSDKASYLLNITNARCCTINGLCIDGNDFIGENIHGIYKDGANDAKKEDSFKIERCKISHFSGNGIHLKGAWCYSVRHSMSCDNNGHGILSESCDGFLIDNWFSGNEGAGFYSDNWTYSTTFTGNRFEWNKKAGAFIKTGDNLIFNGNYFDRSGGPGLSINTGDSFDTQCITISTNLFYRNGSNEEIADSNEDSHIMLNNIRGLTCVGNTFSAFCDDGGKSGRMSPNFGVVYARMENTVIKDNVWHRGVMNEFLVDLGGNADTLIIKDNVGRIK
ncbi:MAG: hypothetical protein BGN88_09755 [Clostridiales bacterium 43-6]|nr:MAG: hypothetical protein BGN88_09755 [Clostridiales bacterium 43-6]